jgi:hypothetical protein
MCRFEDGFMITLLPNMVEVEPSQVKRMKQADESPEDTIATTTLLTTKTATRIGTWNILTQTAEV